MQTLGKYQLIAEIARGGMGIVYLAVASGPGGFSKLFVVKELKPELVEEATFLDMFLEEARLAARLSHPNIVTTYEVGLDGRRPFIVMDYLDGESLGRILRKKSPKFTTAMHLRLLCHALEGLDYAHHLEEFDGTTASVIHRDMSPQNVFVTYDGQVKIVDFGIAKAADTSLETQAGVLKGKPGYMSPEQLSGDVDARADVFSVGVMIWEAVTGRRMWPSKGQVEILTALIKGEIPKLGDVKPDAPEMLKAICDKATARQPDDRYASARELQNALEAYLDSVNERMTVRQIAQVVASLFEEQRKSVRAMLDTCIAQAKSGATTTKLPSMAPPSLETSTPKPIDSTLQSMMAASRTSVPIATASSRSSELAPMSGTPVSQTTAGAAILEPHAPLPSAPRETTRRRRSMLVLLSLATIAGIAIALVVRAGNKGEVARTAAAVTAPPPSAMPVEPAPSPPKPAAPAAAPADTASAVVSAAATPAAASTAATAAAPPRAR
ncbi:MAG: serine/threonine protein kinase, partial [Labilithrix sp.]|nr:serine/threonine protein kinase [Labilithrix sp.]